MPIEIKHPFWMLAFLVLTAATFSLFGFIIGLWADSFEKLQVVPLLVITPLTFLGGSFYSISMLPPVWQTITLFNPIVYLVSGFRWSFYEIADVQRRHQPRHDARVHARLPRDDVVDADDGLAAQEVAGAHSPIKSCRSRLSRMNAQGLHGFRGVGLRHGFEVPPVRASSACRCDVARSRQRNSPCESRRC